MRNKDVSKIDAVTPQWDVIVVGSGVAGLVTATVCSLHGLKVLVCEKTGFFGGTTAWSMGAVWAPCNTLMQGLAQVDDPASAEIYLRAAAGIYFDSAMVKAYVESASQAIDYLQKNTQLRFAAAMLPDFIDADGARSGRALLTEPYDGKALGAYLSKLRNPLSCFTAFGAMQVDLRETARLVGAFKSIPNFMYTARRVGVFLLDLLRYGKGARLANGNALVGRILRSALDTGVVLRTDTAVVRVTKENGKVSGVVVKHGVREQALNARLGVVLASGGFGSNVTMMQERVPQPSSHISVQPEGNTGDGLLLGVAAGGVLGQGNQDNAYYSPTSTRRDRDGKIVQKYPHFGGSAMPGSLIVDPSGQRFVNEASNYHHIGREMNRLNIGTAYLIADERYVTNRGLGLVKPGRFGRNKFLAEGYLKKANDLTALARLLGIEPERLAGTVSRFNEFAARGIDSDFGRGTSRYDQASGDPRHRPNPNIGPLQQPPYYAVAIHPGSASTAMGLKTTPDAQVLDRNGGPIAGLYAVGLDQNSFAGGTLPAGGVLIGSGVVFGYRAALAIAASADAALTESTT
jgi:succinate dehydrogenase/fumarate reductase flavoprotein subunit